MNILQIGCHLGDDHVYEFVKNNDCNNIILVDANLNALALCKNKYDILNRNTFIFNYAIVPHTQENEETIKFYIPKNDTTSAHCSTSLDFIIKHGHKEYTTVDVPCITINNLLSNLNLKSLDRLYIDAEGLDIQIIMSLDLNAINIKYICFEHVHSDGVMKQGINLEKAIEKLNKYGFIETNKDNLNLIFEKK